MVITVILRMQTGGHVEFMGWEHLFREILIYSPIDIFMMLLIIHFKNLFRLNQCSYKFSRSFSQELKRKYNSS